MSSSEFTITLPSNASSSSFPSNTIGSYTVKLQNAIDFGNYEVAMAEIQYPNSWMTVPESVVAVIHPGDANPRLTTMPEGKYNSVEDFIEAIERAIDKGLNSASVISIEYNKTTMKASLTVSAEGWSLYVTQKFANILGFSQTEFKKGKHTGVRNVDLDEGMTALYVYSDIVQPQIVGDALAPLLRVVPIKGNQYDRYRYEEFRHLRYLPAHNVTTNLVQMHISRDDGRPVSFKSGKVIVTLRLRELKK